MWPLVKEYLSHKKLLSYYYYFLQQKNIHINIKKTLKSLNKEQEEEKEDVCTFVSDMRAREPATFYNGNQIRFWIYDRNTLEKKIKNLFIYV